MRRFITFGPALVVLLTALVTLVATPAAVRMIGHARTDANIQFAQQNLEQDNILKAIDRATRAVADAVEPSVVHIAVSEGRGSRIRSGAGSGWVYDERGHIITNAHVVRGAQRITVQFQDGRAADAKLVGLDPATDIAVVQVDPDGGLFPIRRASETQLHQGDRVYAFGSPFGFKFSMSEGIVSALGRNPGDVVGQDGFTNFIQSDAAVNPGNSGGPLVNVEGKLVGMNVAIATAPGLTNVSEGQNSGISFAIPVATIEPVVQQLIAGEVVARGYMGVSRAMTEDENERMIGKIGYKGRGVYITDVPTDGPAGKAGLQSRDIIVSVNGQPATNISTFRSLVASRLPGESVEVEVWRNGDSKTFKVTLGTLPPSETEVRQAVAYLKLYGIRQVVETDDSIEITQMEARSQAISDRVRPEHRIVGVDGGKVTSVQELCSVLVRRGLLQGRSVTLNMETSRGEAYDVTLGQ